MAPILEKMSDRELLERISSDDELAFKALVERYGKRLYNFLQKMVSDWALAEDLLQETFLKIYRKRRVSRRIRDFASWSYTVAANLARDELRKRKRREAVGNPLGADCITDRSARPDVGAETRELRERINSAIQGLSQDHREVFVLRDIEGLSYEEIGRVLRVRVGTVKSRLNRARLRLQEELAPFLT